MDYPAYFKKALQTIRDEQRYRRFIPLQRGRAFPQAQWEEESKTTWCGVDYLGLTQHPLVKAAMVENIEKYGVGSGGTRNIGGTHIEHIALESRLAALHQKEAALIFTSGYVANQTTLSTLGKVMPGLTFLSDADNHMSIIEGIRESGAQKRIFVHNDMQDLERQLASLPLEAPKMIVFESVYSMTGDLAPIAEIIDLAQRYQALTYLDEVHAVGVYGMNGGGLSEELNLASQIDIIQGTLGKAFGLVGGYIAGGSSVIESVRLMGNGFIFTVSLPPALCATASFVLDYLRHSKQEQLQLQRVVAALKQGLKASGIPMLPSQSQIIPIPVGDAAQCEWMAQTLFQHHDIYIQAVNYPTVRKGTERLRISPTALHQLNDVERLVQALSQVRLQSENRFSYTGTRSGS